MRTSATVLECSALSIALTGLLTVASVGSGARLHARSRGQASAASTSLEHAIAAIVPELLDKYHVPGASVAVICEGEIESVLDFGVQRAGSASRVDEHTIFEVASLSKPVFAYGARPSCFGSSNQLRTRVTWRLSSRVASPAPRAAARAIERETEDPVWVG